VRFSPGTRALQLGRCGALVAATLALASCHSSPAQSPGPKEPAWYDAKPLLVSLRPDLREGAATLAGAGQLEDLPLYDLDVGVDLANRTFALGEDLWFTNVGEAPLGEIVLRVYADAIPAKKTDEGPARPPVRLRSGSCTIGGPCTVLADGASAISVRLATPLARGGRVRISLALDGELEAIDSSRTNVLAQGIEGLSTLPGVGGGASDAVGDYGLLAVGDGIASFASFYAVLARRGKDGAWERTDSSTLGDLGPDDLANVRARVLLPAGAKLASSGVVLGEEPVTSDAGAPARRVRIGAALVRDFAMLASEAFQVSASKVGDVDVRSYYLGPERAAGERALDVAVHALADFEKRFGPYPYADFDVVEAAIVGGAGGVEFSGLATAASMLYRPVDAGGGALAELLSLVGASGSLGAMSAMTDGLLEFCVAHEVAHQWWHGMVGSDSREHPFVDEGLAQYSALLYLEDRYGKERATRDGDMNSKMNYQMMRFMGTPDGAVDRPVAQFASGLAYGGLVYGKGPYFYQALRKLLGDDAFFALLRDYTSKNRFREAPGRGPADLAAAGPSGAKVRALSTRWLEETHGDEDLGKLDMSSILGGLLGNAGIGGEDVQSLLQALTGDVTPDAGARKGPKPKGKKPDPAELLRQLMQQ